MIWKGGGEGSLFFALQKRVWESDQHARFKTEQSRAQPGTVAHQARGERRGQHLWKPCSQPLPGSTSLPVLVLGSCCSEGTPGPVWALPVAQPSPAGTLLEAPALGITLLQANLLQVWRRACSPPALATQPVCPSMGSVARRTGNRRLSRASCFTRRPSGVGQGTRMQFLRGAVPGAVSTAPA